MPPQPWQSLGGSMVTAARELLAQRELENHNRMLDELAQRREGRLAQSDASELENQKLSRQLQEQQIGLTRDLRKRQDLEARSTVTHAAAKNLGVGAHVTPALASDMREFGYTVDDTLPSTQQAGATQLPMGPPAPGEMPVPGVVMQGPQRVDEGGLRFAGTPQQQAFEDLKGRADLTPEQQKYLASVEATGDRNIDASVFTPKEPKPARTQVVGGILFQEQQDGTWKQVAEGKDDSKSASGGTPYFIPVQTGGGVLPFNARTGQFSDDNRRDLKPGETAQKELVNAESVLYRMRGIADQFNPAWAGPAAGRFKTMQLALIGEFGDTGLAALQSDVAGLQNTVIQLRTGAQMSEQEATRILREVPDFNLPPDVFSARLQRAQSYFEDWYKRRSDVAYGRRGVTTGYGTTPPLGPAAPPAATPQTTETPEQRRKRLYDQYSR